MTDSTEKPKQTFRVLVFLAVEDKKDQSRSYMQSYDKSHENPLTALIDLAEAMEVSFTAPTDYSMARIEVTHGAVAVSFRSFGGKWWPILYPYDDGIRALTTPPAPAADPTSPAPAEPPADPTAGP